MSENKEPLWKRMLKAGNDIKDKAADKISDATEAARNKAEDFRNQRELKGIVHANLAAMSFTLINDGEGDSKEVTTAINTLFSNPEISAVYTRPDLEEILDDYVTGILDDWENDTTDGLERALRAVRDFHGTEDATTIMENALKVAEVDGVYNASEKLAIMQLAYQLGLDPADYGVTETQVELEEIEQAEMNAE